MRIKAIELSWFRGAAETANLNLESKSTVVYGQNESGKSSFVDAIEYAIMEGKVGHLIHEYSGRHQEKGIINTHTPKERTTEFRLHFDNEQTLRVKIDRDGSWTTSGAESIAISTWDYRRTVLRQDEVASFIRQKVASIPLSFHS